ncbi:MAG: trypsin-like peptidase domain-containing protein [Phycisphaerae bacterium]|jgi:serine protease Do
MHNVLCGMLAGVVLAGSPAVADEAREASRMPTALAQVFDAALHTVSPSIVRVDTIGGAPPVAPDSAAGEGGQTFQQADGPTTGLICSADGYILTSSFNFMRDPSVITVRLDDGRRFVAYVVARDDPAGLTLIKIAADDLPVPRWLPPSKVRPGQWALVAGYGYGSATPTLSAGVISAGRRLDDRAVQTDARTSPANYGGPLFDVEGRVIGICVPKAGGDEDQIAGAQWYDSGIGFAIHADYINERLPRLMRGEDLERGYLGVTFDRADPVVGSADAASLGGVRILAATPGPAMDAGLAVGDVVTHVNGRAVERFVELRRELIRLTPGQTIELTWRREGVTQSAAVTLIGWRDLLLRGGAAPEPRPATMPAQPESPGTAP